jgi:dUTP pyrophosphatase
MIFMCSDKATMPKYSTEYSSCFDLHACLDRPITSIYFSNVELKEVKTELAVTDEVVLPANSRSLIPTGLKFSIPINCSVRLHPRSGLSFKNGIMLSNAQGIIDEDYYDEVFVSVFNSSQQVQVIKHGDRICQAELVVDSRCHLVQTYDCPMKKSSRAGGFGSTGK